MEKFQKLSRSEMKNVIGGKVQKCDPGDPSLIYQCYTTTYHYIEAGIGYNGQVTVCGCFAAKCTTP